ncbi:DNA-binding protein [Candidatus Pacearchaeota archaeon]|nr:DNA-binding protein [Candidatus Pacearchaeota archaeon]
MAKEIWEIWLENTKKRQNDFEKYLKSKKIKAETEIKELVEGHINKADHNLKFVMKTLELQEFNDWAIVSAYYSIYHASLALCALKGYSTKDHLATLLILIKEFYQKQLNKEEIEMVSKTTIEKEEVLYYIEAKAERKKASYSTKILFDEKEAEILQKKAIGFVNKVKEIIDSNSK